MIDWTCCKCWMTTHWSLSMISLFFNVILKLFLHFKYWNWCLGTHPCDVGGIWWCVGGCGGEVSAGDWRWIDLFKCKTIRKTTWIIFYVTFNFICDLFMLPFLILNVIEFVLVRSWFKFFPPGGFLPSGDVTCSESTCSESSPKMESSESIFFEWTYDGGGGNSKTSDLINRLSSLKIVPTSLSSWSSSSSRRSSWMFELNFHVNRESLRVNPKTVCQTFNLTVPQ